MLSHNQVQLYVPNTIAKNAEQPQLQLQSEPNNNQATDTNAEMSNAKRYQLL
jgi:hypothetical protein